MPDASAKVTQSAEDFLITAAARDFQRNVAAEGVDFKDVYLGTLSENGLSNNLLCGKFRTLNNAQWTPFATIQTDPYENWLGGLAAHYCTSEHTILDTDVDLSERLAIEYLGSK